MYKAAVQAAVKEAVDFDATPIDSPILLEGEFVMRRVKRLRKDQINEPHVAKPDLDNLIKSTQDAIVDAGIFRDDCLIRGLNFTKRYANPDEAPHARILIVVESFQGIDTIKAED